MDLKGLCCVIKDFVNGMQYETDAIQTSQFTGKNTRTPNKLLQKVFQRFWVVFDIKNNILKVPQNPTSGKP